MDMITLADLLQLLLLIVEIITLCFLISNKKK